MLATSRTMFSLQPRAMGLKVSDEFTVPLCRTPHRELHQTGNEAAWCRSEVSALLRLPSGSGPKRAQSSARRITAENRCQGPARPADQADTLSIPDTASPEQ